MFTGIIEEIGHLNNVKKGTASAILTIQAEKVLEGTHIGDSIAVNGVCLTVTGIYDNTFTADVMHETLNRSSLGKLVSGSAINLERAMAADGRFGGHIVSGHIDGTGKVVAITKDDNAIWYQIKTDSGILKYIVEKGSVAIDGISLTVAKTDSQSFSVSIIPHTAGATTLSLRKAGDVVNLENDIVVLTWSIDTVNAVSWLSVLSATICVSPSFLHKSPLIGMHISPFPYVAMKFTFSVVANSAAHIRSPSFSLLSSSETSISFPSCKSLTASSTVLYSNIFFYLPFPLIF